tara:strand:+ start:57 stop:1130 length:1074 start_codon:yes stop_codon:yes gene_type:complete
MAIYRYPYRNPVPGDGSVGEGPTEAVDYIVIKRNRRVYKNNGKSYYSARGLGSGDTLEKSFSVQGGNNTVYLAMPPQLATAYQAGYQKVDVGIVGMGALEMFAGGNANASAEALQKSALAMLPEFTTSGVAQIINSASGVLGLAGQLNPNTIQALTQGKVFNPYSEQIFNSMGFRTHTFNFKLVSRNAREAQEIKSIIRYLKVGMAPKVEDATSNKDGLGSGGTKEIGKDIREKIGLGKKNDEIGEAEWGGIFKSDTGRGKNQRFFRTPDHYDLKFVRAEDGRLVWAGNQQDNPTRTMHFKIHPSYCTGVSVNYTPDGQYTSFKNFDGSMVQVPAINLGLSFVETRLISQADMEDGF